MSLSYLLYVSECAQPMDRRLLTNMLRRAQARNRETGITGILLYSAGHFIQLLEGPPVYVKETFDRIRSDPRHKHVRVLLEEKITARLFDRWYMGLLIVDDLAPLDRQSLTEAMHVIDSLPEQPDVLARAKALAAIKAFRGALGGDAMAA